MEYVYPATFIPNNDGSYTIEFQDLPGCISEGKDLPNAMYMAEKALANWLSFLLEEGETIPPSSGEVAIYAGPDFFRTLVRVNVRSNRAVRRTISLPEYMDEAASAAGISLSKITQDALKKRLNL